MHKDLPKVYAVPINKKLNNNEETYSSLERKTMPKEEHVISTREINQIFNAKDHVYKSKLEITTKTETKIYEVVGLSHESLLTLDGKLIKLADIIEIKKVS